MRARATLWHVVFHLEFWIPYGSTEIPVRVPDDNFYKILEPAKPGPSKDPSEAVKASLENPVGGLSLREMVSQGASVGLVGDPSSFPGFESVVSTLRGEISSWGAGSVKTFLRKTRTPAQAPDAAESVLMDPLKGPFKQLGKTSQGTLVSIQEALTECEVKVCISCVSPHYAAGFNGGAENFVPGSASPETVASNRSLVLRGTRSPLEWRENLVLADSFEICQTLGATYNVCIVPDGGGGVDSVFCGNVEAAFQQAVERYSQLHSPRIERRPDIVIVAAGPLLGRDLSHSIRVLNNVREIARKEGTVILVAECGEGIGSDTFLELAQRFKEKRELVSELRRRFRLGGQFNFLLEEALERNRIQLVSVLPDHFARDIFRLKTSKTASASVQTAIRAEGKDSKILIVTKGDLLVPTMTIQ